MSEQLTHLDEQGNARMVDVTAKPATRREAIATAVVRMKRTTLAAIEENRLAKGDAYSVARIAAIMAAKRTDELIPLCHPLPISEVVVDFEAGDDTIKITTSVAAVAQTGVEMEALTAATVAALTIYDMAKSVDRGITIESVRLLGKTGGKSGDYHWNPSE